MKERETRGNAIKKKPKSFYYPDGLPENPSRLAIFQCHDKDGIIDDYIPYLLNDLKENLTELVIVVNGKLTPEGRVRLADITPNVFVRADKGFDAAAWKEAMIDYLGWDEVAKYDELILLNDTFFGPLYPFREVFAKMDRRPVDFWGLISHNEVNDYKNICPYGYIPQFIQSFFIAIRKSMAKSYEFKKYWEKQPLFKTYEELILLNEAVFTKHFEDVGFVWETYIDMTGYATSRETALDHNRYNQYWLLSEKGFPVIKRKNFTLPYESVLSISSGSDCSKSLEYVKRSTSYDCSLIFQNITRIYNVTDIKNALHLNYILPKFRPVGKIQHSSKGVVIFHFSYMDMLDYLQQYLQNVPGNIDIILTTKPQKNVDMVYQYLSPMLGDRLRVLLARDPGRDLSALLVTAAPYLNEYDYICFCHDKRSHRNDPLTVGAGFQECLIENTIGSCEYINNVLSLFEEHDELGLLVPPPPNHSMYFGSVLADPWTVCFESVNDLAKKLHLKANIARESPPLTIGTAFWCRRDALAPLLDYPWKLKDFPREPLPDDGTLNHALERIFPFVAQHQGYLTGWVMTDEYASLEINNIHYRLRQMINSTDPALPGSPLAPNIGVKGALVIYLKKHLPKPLWGIARKIKRLLRW